MTFQIAEYKKDWIEDCFLSVLFGFLTFICSMVVLRKFFGVELEDAQFWSFVTAMTAFPYFLLGFSLIRNKTINKGVFGFCIWAVFPCIPITIGSRYMLFHRGPGPNDPVEVWWAFSLMILTIAGIILVARLQTIIFKNTKG